MDRDKRVEQGPWWTRKAWLRTVFPIVTFIVIARVGWSIIGEERELYQNVWVFSSSFIALAIWVPIGRYVTRRQHRN
jgi:hypothetical protein